MDWTSYSSSYQIALAIVVCCLENTIQTADTVKSLFWKSVSIKHFAL